MKWLMRGFVVLSVALVALIAYALSTAQRTQQPVGFRLVQARTAVGKPMAIGIWYPASGTPRPTTLVGGTLMSVVPDGPVRGQGLPLVLISHGNGASLVSHVDLAMALADAGYVVAAPSHPGDNFADQSGQSAGDAFSQRAAQGRETLDVLLRKWPHRDRLDPQRVGAFGFSAGAFTVLTLVGGQPDMAVIPAHCAREPEFICTALRHVNSPLVRTGANAAGTFQADPRIRAAVVAAPGLGFTFGNGGLAQVQVPVQLWSGTQDETVPFASNTRIVAAGLGSRTEVHSVPGATHFSFLAPCGLLKPRALCSDPAGFDRVRAHKAMNDEVIRFFNATLPAATRTTVSGQTKARHVSNA